MPTSNAAAIQNIIEKEIYAAEAAAESGDHLTARITYARVSLAEQMLANEVGLDVARGASSRLGLVAAAFLSLDYVRAWKYGQRFLAEDFRVLPGAQQDIAALVASAEKTMAEDVAAVPWVDAERMTPEETVLAYELWRSGRLDGVAELTRAVLRDLVRPPEISGYADDRHESV